MTGRGPLQTCAALPSAPRMVQEQCCHGQLEELHCAAGINLASDQDACVPPRGDNASLEAMFMKVRTWGPHGATATPDGHRPGPP